MVDSLIFRSWSWIKAKANRAYFSFFFLNGSHILIPPIVIFFSFDATIVGCLCFIFLLVYCVVYPFIWTFYQWNHYDVDASKDHILIGIIDFWSFWFLLDFCMIRNLALAEANHFCNVVKFFFIISFVFHDFFVCTLTTYLYILWG